MGVFGRLTAAVFITLLSAGCLVTGSLPVGMLGALLVLPVVIFGMACAAPITMIMRYIGWHRLSGLLVVGAVTGIVVGAWVGGNLPVEDAHSNLSPPETFNWLKARVGAAVCTPLGLWVALVYWLMFRRRMGEHGSGSTLVVHAPPERVHDRNKRERL